MPNDPNAAKEKRPDPGPRENAQGDHEGSAHPPDEFETMKPHNPSSPAVRPAKAPGAPTGVQ